VKQRVELDCIVDSKCFNQFFFSGSFMAGKSVAKEDYVDECVGTTFLSVTAAVHTVFMCVCAKFRSISVHVCTM